MTQEQLAQNLHVSVQTISRWENGISLPDLPMLPALASCFSVSTDLLLGTEGEHAMVKLIRTRELFEAESRESAGELADRFRKEAFPKLKEAAIWEKDGRWYLETVKEFDSALDAMKFE